MGFIVIQKHIRNLGGKACILKSMHYKEHKLSCIFKIEELVIKKVDFVCVVADGVCRNWTEATPCDADRNQEASEDSDLEGNTELTVEF